MDGLQTSTGTRWRFGIHPAATGMVVRSIDRVEFPVGDALRIELADPAADPATTDVVHVQYHVITQSGGWALWISATADVLRAAEAQLPELVTPAEPDPTG